VKRKVLPPPPPVDVELYTVEWTTTDGRLHTMTKPLHPGDIAWTGWLEHGKVVHVIAFQCSTLTYCGNHVTKTAAGIAEWAKDRMCLSCMRRVAWELSGRPRRHPWLPPK